MLFSRHRWSVPNKIPFYNTNRSMAWMIIGPFARLFNKSLAQHPLYKNFHITTTNILAFQNTLHVQQENNIDFWGPCLIVGLYGLVLWVGKVNNCSWIYVIWGLAGTFNHLVGRVYCKSSLMIHTALLGYSVTPTVFIASFILFLRPPVWVATLLEIMSVTWASTSAILCYYTLVDRGRALFRLKLLFPAVILMHLYMVSLLPIRHWWRQPKRHTHIRILSPDHDIQ